MSDTFEKRDDMGNRMIAQHLKSGNFRIGLQLIGEKRTRLLGFIDVPEKTFYCKRIRSKHLHRLTGCYGFNDTILRGEPEIEKVYLQDEYGTYIIPAKIILEKGKYLYFKQTGFEKQVFISYEIIQNFKHGKN